MSKIRSERLRIALVTSLQSKAAFEYFNILAALSLSLPSLVASPRVAGKTAKALSEHMHSHMASVSEERAVFDLDLVTGLRILGGGLAVTRL